MTVASSFFITLILANYATSIANISEEGKICEIRKRPKVGVCIFNDTILGSHMWCPYLHCKKVKTTPVPTETPTETPTSKSTPKATTTATVTTTATATSTVTATTTTTTTTTANTTANRGKIDHWCPVMTMQNCYAFCKELKDQLELFKKQMENDENSSAEEMSTDENASEDEDEVYKWSDEEYIPSTDEESTDEELSTDEEDEDTTTTEKSTNGTDNVEDHEEDRQEPMPMINTSTQTNHSYDYNFAYFNFTSGALDDTFDEAFSEEAEVRNRTGRSINDSPSPRVKALDKTVSELLSEDCVGLPLYAWIVIGVTMPLSLGLLILGSFFLYRIRSTIRSTQERGSQNPENFPEADPDAIPLEVLHEDGE